MLQFLRKVKLYTKLPLGTAQQVFLSNLFVTSCISPLSTKAFFTKERHIDGSLAKSITLSENTPGICQTYCFCFFSVIAMLILFFVFCIDFNSSSFSCSNAF